MTYKNKMKTKTIFLIFILFIMISICGCLEQNEVTNIQSYRDSVDSANATETKFLSNNKIIEGKVVNILFRKNERDVLIFEDGVVITCCCAENHIWKIGKNHKITIQYDWLDANAKSIRKVELLDD